MSQREAALERATDINIRNISIKCGHCNTYQTLSAYSRREDWNVYTYECENDVCDPAMTRTLLEVPRQLDAFARRDPSGGAAGVTGRRGRESRSRSGYFFGYFFLRSSGE